VFTNRHREQGHPHSTEGVILVNPPISLRLARWFTVG
jgi:hypothetical protein